MHEGLDKIYKIPLNKFHSEDIIGVVSPYYWVRCRGNESDSKSRGYIGEGGVLATARLYAQIYEFRPLSEEVTALRLGVTEAFRLDVRNSYRGCEPLC